MTTEALIVEQELLGCPWCGGAATVLITDVRPCNIEGWTNAYSVWCRDSVKCSGRLPRLFQSRDDAITAWNTRTLSRPLPDREETFESIAQWCEETFGPVRPSRIAARANEEMAELLIAVETGRDDAIVEAADVIIVLSRFPNIWKAVEAKMAINRKRKWRLTGDGCGYHIPEVRS